MYILVLLCMTKLLLCHNFPHSFTFSAMSVADFAESQRARTNGVYFECCVHRLLCGSSSFLIVAIFRFMSKLCMSGVQLLTLLRNSVGLKES